jgi:glycosyltransferase involved in cell wall biosynthesis
MITRFSVLIPAYNAEKYIKECVLSVVMQNCKDAIQIVIADDGSTDSTKKICQDLLEYHKNIEFYSKNNEGLVATRQFLLSKAVGEYVLFLDADDKWDTNLLPTLACNIGQYNSPDVVCFGFYTWSSTMTIPFDRGIPNAMYYCNDSVQKGKLLFFETDRFNSIWCKAVKRKVYEQTIFSRELYSIKQGEDKLLTMFLLRHTNSICIIPDNLYLYKVDNSSMTRNFYPESFRDILVVDGMVYGEMTCMGASEISLIQWANTLLNKFFDYVNNVSIAKLPANIVKNYDKEYTSSEVLQIARKLSRDCGVTKYVFKSVLSSYVLLKLVRGFYKLKHVFCKLV